MPYYDGFVAAVPAANKEDYRKHAAKAAVIFRKHGALAVAENWGDDIPKGKQTDFFQAVECKDDEVVVFSWIEWPDKEKRDAAWAKLMDDPEMQPGANPMPFDGKRMIYGGFASLDLSA